MIPETHLEAACDLVAEVVRSTGKASLGVTGCSMLPVIWPGDVLTIHQHCPAESEPGQILLYSRNGRLTAHRVIKASNGFVITRGDSLPTVDEPVGSQDVVGRVVSIQRRDRSLSPRQSFLQAAAAAVMRRSELFKRMYLRLSGTLQPTRMSQPLSQAEGGYPVA
jgi:signal peptidase I